nr:hypothetical protein B0A51_01481 [Rachicladosporium sp. CCFEE 5018]
MTLALRRFATGATTHWDQVRFVVAIKHAYEDTDDAVTAIRKELVGLAAEHAVELYTTATCSRGLIAAVQKYGAFAADLNAALVEKLKKPLSEPAGSKAEAAEGEFATAKNEAAGTKRDADTMKDEEVKVKHAGNDSPPTKRLKGAFVAASLASEESMGSSSTAHAVECE